MVLFPFLLEIENNRGYKWSPPRSHSEEYLSTHLAFEGNCLLKHLCGEANKKSIPKRQEFKINVSNLPSGEERDETLPPTPPVLSMMGKSLF